MNNKIMTVIVSIALGTIVLGGVLMPVINDALDDSREIYNNSLVNLSSVIGEDLEVDVVDRAITIDDASVSLPSTAGILMCTDKFNVIFTDSQVQLFASGIEGVKAITSFNCVIDNQVATIAYVHNDVPGSIEYVLDWGFIFDPDGDYGMVRYYNTNSTVKINNIDDLYGSNILSATNGWFSFHGKNVVADGQSLVAEYTLTPIDGYEGIYNINIGNLGTGYSFDFTDPNGTLHEIHPWVYVIPNEVIGYKDGFSGMSLLLVIPVFVILALLIAAVTLTRRY